MPTDARAPVLNILVIVAGIEIDDRRFSARRPSDGHRRFRFQPPLAATDLIPDVEGRIWGGNVFCSGLRNCHQIKELIHGGRHRPQVSNREEVNRWPRAEGRTCIGASSVG
jgi:hypothetical protein